MNRKDSRNIINLSLDRISGFLKYLGNPQDSFKSVIIGGTNGKGSVTFYLSNIAVKTGCLKVARYISPHLISLNERFVINEKTIDDISLQALLSSIKDKLKYYENESSHTLTEFEFLTAAAFQYFSNEKVDIAFLEVGLGGRLDATNVVKPENVLSSIITNVSYDHMDYLGEDISDIAFEKAGIIKENNLLITNAKDLPLEVILKVAANKNCNAIVLNLNPGLDYIAIAKETAIKSWALIKNKIEPLIDVPDTDFTFLDDLHFDGRFQYFINEKILLDGAHNPDGAIELRKLLNFKFPSKKTIFIIGILDKDYKSFLSNLSLTNELVICTEAKSNRATDKNLISNYLSTLGIRSDISNDLNEAIDKTKSYEHDLIVITGSLYLIGESLALLKNKIK